MAIVPWWEIEQTLIGQGYSPQDLTNARFGYLDYLQDQGEFSGMNPDEIAQASQYLFSGDQYFNMLPQDQRQGLFQGWAQGSPMFSSLPAGQARFNVRDATVNAPGANELDRTPEYEQAPGVQDWTLGGELGRDLLRATGGMIGGMLGRGPEAVLRGQEYPTDNPYPEDGGILDKLKWVGQYGIPAGAAARAETDSRASDFFAGVDDLVKEQLAKIPAPQGNLEFGSVDWTDPAQVARYVGHGVAQGVGSYGPLLALAYAGRGRGLERALPAAGSYLAMTGEAAQNIEDQTGQANDYLASAAGIPLAALEYLPFGEYLNRAGTTGLKGALKNFLGQSLEEGVTEFAQELGNTALVDAVNAGRGDLVDAQWNNRDSIMEALNAGLLGAIGGGGMSLGQSALGAFGGQDEQATQPPQQPPQNQQGVFAAPQAAQQQIPRIPAEDAARRIEAVQQERARLLAEMQQEAAQEPQVAQALQAMVDRLDQRAARIQELAAEPEQEVQRPAAIPLQEDIDPGILANARLNMPRTRWLSELQDDQEATQHILNQWTGGATPAQMVEALAGFGVEVTPDEVAELEQMDTEATMRALMQQSRPEVDATERLDLTPEQEGRIKKATAEAQQMLQAWVAESRGLKSGPEYDAARQSISEQIAAKYNLRPGKTAQQQKDTPIVPPAPTQEQQAAQPAPVAEQAASTQPVAPTEQQVTAEPAAEPATEDAAVDPVQVAEAETKKAAEQQQAADLAIQQAAAAAEAVSANPTPETRAAARQAVQAAAAAKQAAEQQRVVAEEAAQAARQAQAQTTPAGDQGQGQVQVQEQAPPSTARPVGQVRRGTYQAGTDLVGRQFKDEYGTYEVISQEYVGDNRNVTTQYIDGEYKGTKKTRPESVLFGHGRLSIGKDAGAQEVLTPDAAEIVMRLAYGDLRSAEDAAGDGVMTPEVQQAQQAYESALDIFKRVQSGEQITRPSQRAEPMVDMGWAQAGEQPQQRQRRERREQQGSTQYQPAAKPLTDAESFRLTELQQQSTSRSLSPAEEQELGDLTGRQYNVSRAAGRYQAGAQQQSTTTPTRSNLTQTLEKVFPTARKITPTMGGARVELENDSIDVQFVRGVTPSAGALEQYSAADLDQQQLAHLEAQGIPLQQGQGMTPAQYKSLADAGLATIRGAYSRTNGQALMRLVEDKAQKDTPFHEAFHFAWEHLDDAQKRAALKKYKSEEGAADAYGDLASTPQAETWMQTIRRWAEQLLDALGIRTAGQVMRDVQSGKVFQQKKAAPKKAAPKTTGRLTTDDMERLAIVTAKSGAKVMTSQTTREAFLDNAKRISRWLKKDAKNKLKQGFVDVFDPVRAVQEALAGKDIPEIMNAYLLARNHTAQVDAQLRKISAQFIKPIERAIARLKNIDLADVDDYLRAMHVPERNEQLYRTWVTNPRRRLDARLKTLTDDGKGDSLQARKIKAQLAKIEKMVEENRVPHAGMVDDASIKRGQAGGKDTKNANRILEELEAEGKTAALEEVAAHVRKAVNHKMHLLKKHGLVSEKELEAWGKYKHYVPMKGRAQDEELLDLLGDAEIRPHAGKGFGATRTEKRALGREGMEDSTPVLPQLYSDLNEVVVRARKNEVAKAFLRLANEYPSVMVTGKDGKPVRAWTVNKVTMRRYYSSKEGMVRTVEDKSAKQAPNVLPVWVAGELHHVHIGHEGLAKAMKNVGWAETPLLFRTIGKWTRILANLHTSKNLAFLAGNIPRDTGTAAINLGKEDYEGIRWDVMKHVLSGKAAREVWKGIREEDPSKRDPMFQEYLDEGGSPGFFMLQTTAESIRQQVKDIQAAKGDQSKSISLLKSLFANIDDINGTAEKMYRYSTYKHLREKDVSKAKAALLAREVTLDFNRHGGWSAQWGSWFMFFNASVQGTAMIYDGYQNHRSVKNAMRGLFGLGVMQAIVGRILAGVDDDDERNRWEKISSWEKDTNLILPLGFFTDSGDKLKVPLPYGFNVPFVIGRALTDLAISAAGAGKTTVGDALGDIISSTLAAFNPLGGDDFKTLEGFARSLAPAPAQPVVDIALNKNFFGAPLYPTINPFLESQPPDSEQFFPSATKLSQKLADAFNYFAEDKYGMPRVKNKTWDSSISPATIDYLIGGYLGGAGKFVLDTANLILSPITGDYPKVRKIPMLNRFFSQESEYYAQQVFSANVGFVADRVKRYDELLEEDPKLAREFRQDWGWALNLENEKKRIKKQIKKAKDAGDDATAERLIKSFNRRFDQAEEGAP